MKNKKAYIIFSIIIVIFCIALTEKTFQNDTYALISLGKSALVNGVDGYDHLTFHENLKSAHTSVIFEILLYKIYTNFGFQGIYFFTIILSIINGLVLFNIINKRSISITIAFLLSIFSIYYSSGIFTARPTIMVMPMFLIIVICIEKILETNNNKYCILLLIFSILLGNSHGVLWIVHFIFYLPFLAEHILTIIFKDKIIDKLKKNNIIIEKYKNIKKILIVIVLDLICGFITPFSGGNYIIIKELFWTVTGKLEINELGAVNLIDSMSICFIISILAIHYGFRYKKRIADIFMLLGLIILALLGMRYGVFLYYIGSIYILKILNTIIIEYKREDLLIKLDKYISKTINLIIILLIFLIISIRKIKNRQLNNYVSYEYFPIEICDYLSENYNLEELRVYNHFNYGAYLEFKEIPNFIDGRAGIYYQKYKNSSIIEDFCKVVDEGEYEEIFKKHDITHAILYNTEKANEKIYNDENYELIYQTDIFSLYLRKK